MELSLRMSFKRHPSQPDLQGRLRLAASSALNRIRRDRERAPANTADIFSCLEQQIFSQGIDVNQLGRACGKHPNSITAIFRKAAGETPHRYITARRVETAVCLLIDTDLKNWMIADLVGFSNESIFCRNFKKWTGLPPHTFHKRVRHVLAGSDTRHPIFSIDDLRKSIEQGIESSLAAQLLAKINNTNFPCHNPSVPAAAESPEVGYATMNLGFSEEMLEEIRNQSIWETIRQMPLDIQQHVVRNRLFLYKPTFFHFLRRISAPEGRGNREYGIHIAELALSALRATERQAGKDLPSLICQGWAWVGNARRLAFDLDGAERAFANAEIYMGLVGQHSLVKAEYFILKASLRRWQRRSEEALELCNHALPTFRAVGSAKDVARAFLEGANIAEQAGKTNDCIAFLEQVLEHIEDLDSTHLKFTVYYNLAGAYAKTGKHEDAIELLPLIRDLLPQQTQEAISHLHWLEGVIANEAGDKILAERLFRQARRGFHKNGNIGCTSLVDLELALVYLEQGRNMEVMRLTSGVIPIFESLRSHEEAGAALSLMRGAVERNKISADILDEIRQRLDLIRLDPTVNFETLEIRKRESLLNENGA